MWIFIKHCLFCMGITISAAFGYNPSGLTWKTGLIGVATAVVLFAVVICIICLASFVIQKNK